MNSEQEREIIENDLKYDRFFKNLLIIAFYGVLALITGAAFMANREAWQERRPVSLEKQERVIREVLAGIKPFEIDTHYAYTRGGTDYLVFRIKLPDNPEQQRRQTEQISEQIERSVSCFEDESLLVQQEFSERKIENDEIIDKQVAVIRWYYPYEYNRGCAQTDG